MNTIQKIAVSLGGAALVVTGAVGMAGLANAETPSTAPAPATQTWQRGLRNGAGYGATQNASDLAGRLGVPADAVSAALARYHAENPVTTRGRDLSAEQQDAAHEKLATFLATELKVDKAKGRAERTAQVRTRLESAVKAGTLTQEQADAVVAAHESGAMGGGTGGMGGGMGRGPRR